MSGEHVGNMTFIRSAALGAVIVVIGAGSASAQMFNRDRNTSVRERSQPEYEPDGVELGAFTLYADVPISVSYDDNVFATDTDAESDVIVGLEPRLELRSTWSRHELVALASADHVSHQDFDNEDRTDMRIGVRGRLDITRATQATASLNAGRVSESRTSSSSPEDAIEPLSYDEINLAAGLSHEFNRVRVDGSVKYSDFDHDDGVRADMSVIEQDDRDHTTTVLTGRASYAVSPTTAVFAEASYDKRSYDLSPPDVAIDRDSDGYSVLLGADFDITRLMRGSVGLGHFSQDYEDVGASDVNGFAASASVEWFLSPLTTIGVGASRRVSDTGLDGANGAVSAVLDMRVDHELRRNVILSATASVRQDEFEGVNREDTGRALGLEATYLVNKRIGIAGGYQWSDRDSSGVDGGTGFDRNVIGMRLIVRT